jgi:protein phosphatase
MFKLLAFGATHVGRERKNNEDSYRIEPEAGLYLVCDGMGGHASGEIASQIAADTMVRFVTVERHKPEFRWPAEVQHQQADEARSLDAAVRLANVEVYASAAGNPSRKGMGTTVVGVLASGQRLGLVHVGDSRIYRLRDDEFEQLTDDHSLLNHYMRTRPMSAQQVRQFAAKNVIVRAVGLRDAVEPDVQLQDYRSGDVYLLCSDGLTDMVEDGAIATTLRVGREDLEQVAGRLIELALDGGGKDNVTLVLLKVVHDDKAPAFAKPRTERTQTSLEDTSPGFDVRQGVIEEETLPEFNVQSSGAAKPVAWTQRIVHQPGTQAELSGPDAARAETDRLGALPGDEDDPAFAATERRPQQLRDTGRHPRVVLTNVQLDDCSGLDDLLAPEGTLAAESPPKPVPAPAVTVAVDPDVAVDGETGAEMKVLRPGPPREDETPPELPPIGLPGERASAAELREATDRVPDEAIVAVHRATGQLPSTNKHALRSTEIDGAVARRRPSEVLATDGMGRPNAGTETDATDPEREAVAPAGEPAADGRKPT